MYGVFFKWKTFIIIGDNLCKKFQNQEVQFFANEHKFAITGVAVSPKTYVFSDIKTHPQITYVTSIIFSTEKKK